MSTPSAATRASRWKRLTLGLAGLLLAETACSWALALSIDGQWDSAGTAFVDANYALLGAVCGTALAAFGAAVFTRSWRLILATLALGAFGWLYAFVAAVAIGLSTSDVGLF